MNPLVWKAVFSTYALTHWTVSYLVNSLGRDIRPVHVIFCTVDHYEPGTGNVSPEVERERVGMLLGEYPVLAGRHRDSSGNVPKRTWFFPPHYHRHNNLKNLVSLCEKGFGEIELHLHHGKTRPDTPGNFAETVRSCVEDYSRFGIFGTEEGRKRFGFIHGDWALNNSLGGSFCGVNNELAILKDAGCYADFTFPSRGRSNPLTINSLFYARDIPGRPKSHSRGVRVCASKKEDHGLMLIQGPLFPHFNEGRMRSLRMSGDIIAAGSVKDGRIDSWVRTWIHVKGRKNWVFVKTHTHGAADHRAVLGPDMDALYRCLETRYDDGRDYVLHYVTAREMYNMIKAAESGNSCDDPELYRDYAVKPPIYDSSPDFPGASEELMSRVRATYPVS